MLLIRFLVLTWSVIHFIRVWEIIDWLKCPPWCLSLSATGLTFAMRTESFYPQKSMGCTTAGLSSHYCGWHVLQNTAVDQQWAESDPFCIWWQSVKGTVHFKPTCLGTASTRLFEVKNASRIALRLTPSALTLVKKKNRWFRQNSLSKDCRQMPSNSIIYSTESWFILSGLSGSYSSWSYQLFSYKMHWNRAWSWSWLWLSWYGSCRI